MESFAALRQTPGPAAESIWVTGDDFDMALEQVGGGERGQSLDCEPK